MPTRITNKIIDEKLKKLNKGIKRYEDYDASPTRKDEIKFICDKSHIFDFSLGRMVNRPTKCPLCNAHNHWNNEFVDQEIQKNNFQLKRLSDIVGAHYSAKWQCLKNPEHIWENIPIEVIKNKRCKGHCPHCGQRAKITEEELIKRIKKNNPTITLLIYKRKNYLFQCKICSHQWKLNGFKDIMEGRSQCPKCALAHNKTENFVYECLLKISDKKYIKRRHYITKIKIKNYKNEIIRNQISIDFKMIHNNKIYFIEYNGPHHYTPTKYNSRDSNEDIKIFHENQKIRDEWLREYCKNNNIILLELNYSHFPHWRDIEIFLQKYFN